MTVYHIDKRQFKVPFVCGAKDLGEALRRINEGASMIRTKGEPGTGDIVQAVRHMRKMNSQIAEIVSMRTDELYEAAKKLEVPYDLVQYVHENHRLPVVNFAAGGVATPADAALMMQLGAEGVFVGSGIFKSGDPAKRAAAIVQATTNYNVADLVAKLSEGLGEAMDWYQTSRRPQSSWQKGVSNMQVGVLAVQGAFAEHEHVLSELGVSCIELRNAGDLNKPYDALILPGGESTVQGKLLRDSDMFDTIKSQIKGGMPVLATCAGLILLAQHIEGDDTVHLGTLPVTVKRNAYGRQLGSFHTEAELKGIGEVPMTFIRAPYVAEASPEVNVLATVDDKIVAVKYGNQFALSFHPELDSDYRIHKAFVDSIQ